MLRGAVEISGSDQSIGNRRGTRDILLKDRLSDDIPTRKEAIRSAVSTAENCSYVSVTIDTNDIAPLIQKNDLICAPSGFVPVNGLL